MSGDPDPPLFTFRDLTFWLGVASLTHTVLDKCQTPLIYSLSIGMLVGVMGAGMQFCWAHYYSARSRFEVYDDADATAHIPDIERASQSIVLTHFNRREPSERYRKLLQEKLTNKVTLVRFLPEKLELTLPENAWLESDYRDAGRFYHAIEVRSRLPFELFIIDDRIVRITLTDSASSPVWRKGIRIENTQVAHWFSNMLRSIQETPVKS